MEQIKRTVGIHTFELEYRLSKEEYQFIKNVLFNLCNGTAQTIYKDKYNCYKCNLYANEGILIFVNVYSLKLIINPSRIINSNDIMGLYAPEEDLATHKYFSTKLLNKLETILPNDIIANLYISRMDYTIDVYMPSDEHVLLMIKLAKKNGLPKGFKETFPSHCRNAENFNRSFSYDISHTRRHYNFKLYAKHKQLLACRKNLAQVQLDSANGVLRAEISCRHNENTMFLWNCNESITYFSLATLNELYNEIIPKIFPYGVYLKSSIAKKKLKELYKNERTLQKYLLLYLANIYNYHSFHGAYQKLNTKNILKKDILYAFYSNGINPITIALNDDICCIPSIYTLLGLNNCHAIEETELFNTLKYS